jgi:cell division protein FtsB
MEIPMTVQVSAQKLCNLYAEGATLYAENSRLRMENARLRARVEALENDAAMLRRWLANGKKTS